MIYLLCSFNLVGAVIVCSPGKGDIMKKRRIIIIIIAVLAVLLGALILDSNCRIVVTEHSVCSENLPESFDGFSIVQLSDIHGRCFGKDNSRLLKTVEDLSPDIIVITGDLADKHADIAVIDALMERLCAIADVYYVSGNHEWGFRRIDELKEVFAKHGVCYLANEYKLLEREGESIVLCGVEDPNAYFDMPKPDDVVECIDSEQGESFRILLGHRNYWTEKYPRLDVDLIFCGHAHGGLVRLPGVGGLFGTGFEIFPQNVDGAVESGRYTMIVSRGIGNSAPVPRVFNNPEIIKVQLEAN